MIRNDQRVSAQVDISFRARGCFLSDEDHHAKLGEVRNQFLNLHSSRPQLSGCNRAGKVPPGDRVPNYCLCPRNSGRVHELKSSASRWIVVVPADEARAAKCFRCLGSGFLEEEPRTRSGSTVEGVEIGHLAAVHCPKPCHVGCQGSHMRVLQQRPPSGDLLRIPKRACVAIHRVHAALREAHCSRSISDSEMHTHQYISKYSRCSQSVTSASKRATSACLMASR